MKAAEKNAITSTGSQYGSVKCYLQLSQVSSESVAAAAAKKNNNNKKKKKNKRSS